MEVLKTSGKPVASTLCISPHGDKDGVVPGECAVRLVKAGTLILYNVVLKCLLRSTEYSLKYQGQSKRASGVTVFLKKEHREGPTYIKKLAHDGCCQIDLL